MFDVSSEILHNTGSGNRFVAWQYHAITWTKTDLQFIPSYVYMNIQDINPQVLFEMYTIEITTIPCVARPSATAVFIMGAYPCVPWIRLSVICASGGHRGTKSRMQVWYHGDVIKWKHFLCYWSFVRGIHRLPVNSPHKGQWRGALMYSLIWARTNVSVNNRDAGDLRRNHSAFSTTRV